MLRTGLSILAAVATVGAASAPHDIDCTDVLGRIEISTVLDKRKEVRIRSFFESLTASGYSARELELVADLAGIANPRLDDEPTIFIIGASDLPSPPTGYRHLSRERATEVYDLIDDGRLDELAELADEDPSLARSYMLDLSVAALALLPEPDVLAGSLDRLIDAGFEFGLHELASAIAADVTVDTFELLLDNSDSDLSEPWQDERNNRPMDLAGLAASKPRLDLLGALLRRKPNPDDSRAIDYLPTPATAEEVSDTEAILQRLAAVGYKPLLPSTTARLREWVPETTFASLRLDGEVRELTRSVRTVGERFRREIRGLDAALATVREHESPCLADDSGDAGNPGSLLAKQRTGTYDKTSPFMQGGETAAIFSALMSSETPGLNRSRDPIVDITDAVLGSRWEEFVQIAEHAEPPTLTFIFRVSLSSAPFDVVAKLLARTGELPADAAILVARRRTGGREVLEKLQENDLDLHFVDSSGVNAVGAAALKMSSRDTLEYLLDEGVAVKLDTAGYDPLDYVLLNLVHEPRFRNGGTAAVAWIETLLDHDAPIEASHLQLMELLGIDRPDTYADIIDAVPALGNLTDSSSG